MENVTEEYLRQLAYLNPSNEKILWHVRRVYKELMMLRQVMAVYEDALNTSAFM